MGQGVRTAIEEDEETEVEEDNLFQQIDRDRQRERETYLARQKELLKIKKKLNNYQNNELQSYLDR